MSASPLRRLLGYARPEAGILLRAFAAMAVLGLTTGAYAYLMGPALRFLLTGGHQGLGLVGRWFPQLLTVERERLLFVFPGLVVAIAVAKAFAYLGQFYWMGLFGQKVAMSLRRDVFRKLCALSPAQLSNALSGDLLSRFSTDVAAVEVAATYTVASYVRDGLQIAVLVAVAISLEWRLALAACLLVPLAALPVSRLTKSFLARTREGAAQLGSLAAQVQEGLGGMRTLQAFNAQQAELRRFDATARIHRQAMVRAGWVRGAVPGLMEIFAAGAIATALALVAGSQSVPPENLVSLLTAVVLIYQPAKDLGRVSQFAVQAAAAGERLYALLDLPDPVRDVAQPLRLPPLQRSLRLERVVFSYGERRALQGLDLELPAGKTTALVGPSGGGKSTLAALLLRFASPQEGRILIDGLDVAAASVESVRAQFALVTQEPLLFSASVLDNLRFAKPDATFDEVVEAARVASADAFVRALPQGYDTPLGERGVVLSGGQRQRLCLARAVLAQAPVLILDEATSSLDPASEREVQAALQQVLPGRTALVIAHRLGTIVNADRIHVLADGRVVEQGTHAELLAARGHYARLWNLQQRPEGEAA